MKIINLLWPVMCLLCLITGMYFGAVLQQEHFIKGAVLIAEGLEGSTFDIDIDLNETQLIEGFKESFIPLLNETIHEGDDDE